MKITILYWKEDGWYVGKLKEFPDVFSQGQTLDELVENLKDAYELVKEEDFPNAELKVTETQLELV